MKLFALTITMMALTACVTPSSEGPSVKSVEKINLSSSGVRSLENAVRDRLKDPSSAQFGKYIAFNAIDDDGVTTTVTCGYVNSKNSYGGYVGMTPYIALGASNTFLSASISEYSMKVCQSMYGVSI